jgi:hypothetical protein
LSGAAVQENADINIYELPGKLFIPINVEFNTQVPEDILKELETDPNQAFDYDYRGTNFKGFLVTGAFAPNDNKDQQYKLLLSPNNDLNELVDG